MKTKDRDHSLDLASAPRRDRAENMLRFRCPPALPAVVRRVADEQMLSVSSYLRRATAEQLKRDGVDLNSHGAA
jgi:hypothetical protein